MTEEFHGEMITAAYLAMKKFDSSLGLKPSTLIYKYCYNRMLTLIKRDKLFYEKHTFKEPLQNFPSKSHTPFVLTMKHESDLILKKCGLSARTKEIITYYLDNPELTLEEVGKHLGVSKQAIHQHMLSARQYFERNKLEFEI